MKIRIFHIAVNRQTISKREALSSQTEMRIEPTLISDTPLHDSERG